MSLIGETAGPPPGDIIKDNKDTTPFRKLTEEEHAASRHRNYGEVEIEAIFVFADSRDWATPAMNWSLIWAVDSRPHCAVTTGGWG